MRSLEWSLARESIDRSVKATNKSHALDHIRLLHVTPHYVDYTIDTDIFQYIAHAELELLRSDTDTFLLFDLCIEGFSAIYDQPYIAMLYHNADKHNIPYHKIFFVSGNIKDDDNLALFNATRRHSTSINVIGITALEFSMRDAVFGTFYAIDRLLIDPFEFFETRFRLTYQGKWFSSLSRIVKPHRAAATYLLMKSRWVSKAIVSHDRIFDDITNWSFFKDLTQEERDTWQNSLPIIADTDDFSINQAMNINSPIHYQTLFQIVNETMVDDRNNTSLFYSEKTFKPIGHLQPFLIYGQPGCNRNLQILGYQLYTDWFDYDFDDEIDPIKRYKMLLTSVEKSCQEIANDWSTNLIGWRFRNREILKHNFEVFKKASYTMSKASIIVDRLLSYSSRP